MSVQVGVTLPQFSSDVGLFKDGARRAAALGFDSLWVFDHLWPLSGGKERPVLECWSALAWLAGAIPGPHIGTLVTRSSLRHPALLAKMAANVGAIARGRLIVGVGSGDENSRGENEAFGIPYYGGDDRFEQLRSTVEILGEFLRGEPVTHRDKFAQLDDLPVSPSPSPAPKVWVGGRAEAVLRLVAESADGWNAWASTPAALTADVNALRQAAGGRDVEVSWAGQVVLGSDDADAAAKLGTRNPKAYLVGGPRTIAAALTALIDAGASHLILAFPDGGTAGVYELAAAELLPALR